MRVCQPCQRLCCPDVLTSEAPLAVEEELERCRECFEEGFDAEWSGRRVRLWCSLRNKVLVKFPMLLVKPMIKAVLERAKALLKGQNRRNMSYAGRTNAVKLLRQCLEARID